MFAEIRNRLAPWPRFVGAAAGGLSILLGLLVLAAWALHAPQSLAIMQHQVPMQRNTALAFALLGAAMIGAALDWRRVVLVCAGLVEALAAATAMEFIFHVDLGVDQLLGSASNLVAIPNPGRMAPTAVVCFLILATAFVVSEIERWELGASVFGIGGCILAGIGLASCIALLSQENSNFVLGAMTRMAVLTAFGFLILGIGATALGWNLSAPATREPKWVPVAAGLFVATARFGLWQVVIARNRPRADLLSVATLIGVILSAIVLAMVAHYALKARLQRETMRAVNRRLEKEITERRLAQEVAQAASRAKDEFLANMSHEIRTPMTGVRGMIDLVLSTPLEREQREHLELARSSADSLLYLLNDILDLSKIEAGRLDLAPVAFSIRRCVAEAVGMFQVRAKEKGLELAAGVDANVPDTLVGDQLRLRQVLVNLIGNAVKFTDHGRVAIRVGLERQTRKEVIVLADVSDTGIGIPRDKHELVFDPFRQADGSMVRRYGGTGLGLTISARLVRLMGGRIQLTSEVGKGSSFSFTVRLARAAEGAPLERGLRGLSEAVANPGHRARSLRILVAEDNIVNQRLVSELLRREGHDATVVSNGSEAVLAHSSGTFDVILMDVQMPVMDGLEATATIRQAETGTVRHSSIIAMTAHAMKGDEQRCLDAGMDDYLTKPIDFEDLRAMLEKWALPGRSSINFDGAVEDGPPSKTLQRR